jgi:hypothetical protein
LHGRALSRCAHLEGNGGFGAVKGAWGQSMPCAATTDAQCMIDKACGSGEAGQ